MLQQFIIALSSPFSHFSVYNFNQALDLKKGEAEAILRELVRKQNLRRGQNTLAVQFQIRMLTLILADSENE